MSGFSWLELTLLLPILGAVVVSFIKVAGVAMRTSLGFFTATLLTSVAANLTFPGTKIGWLKHFAVDDLAAPMLPVLALLHLLTLLGTAKSRVSPLFCVRLLIAAFVSLAAVTCQTPWMLIALLVLGVLWCRCGI
jgi:NADH-quinone oxidoreductase subunit M